MTVRNQYLFSQAYLNQVMADPSHDEAAATLAQGLSDWEAFRDDASLSTLIDSWVGPVLDILGFHHQGVEGQPGLERLHADFTAQELLGLCLTVPPGADIDSTIKGVHYAFQIIAALQEEGCTWGVLTDGSHWRLVKADVLRPYETYLEADLGQMSTRPTAETLRVFHTFFRRDAFLPDDEGNTGLDEHLSRSEEAAEAIQKHLKDKMESVLSALCRGFVMADGRQSYTDEQRAEIFENATYLLFRILFILYAEARGLLPVGNPAYDEIGMQRLVEQAVRCHREGVPDPASTTLWDGLCRLSRAIYESDEARGVPAYDGGLFSDEDTNDFSKGYLRDCFISDPHLASALFDLTRIPTSNGPDGYQPIDYRDLSVRALGGLYEGMLEYKLFWADQKMYGIPDGKGGYQYKLATQVERPKRTYREIDAGEVYFAHSPTQRKATGSYYTPEYIVEHIVKETVQQGLRERREALDAKLADWLGEVAGALDEAEGIRLQEAVDRELLHFVENEVLTYRVCDPAMGSGHFLVNAAHTIANFIVETLNLAPWENAQVDTDPLVWRRWLVESCIYGVDLNPLAVELAKLSLWLHTVVEAKPLNFLDHHLKVGNSLIGAWVKDLVSLPTAKRKVKQKRAEVDMRQIGLFEQLLADQLPIMLGEVLDIAKQPSDELEDIRVKEAADQAVDNRQAPFKAIADLWVSAYFGNEVTESEYQEGLRHITELKQLLPLPGVRRARAIAEQRRFFHWELEFPEIFYEDSTTRENPGFDAVVGNPPYGQKGTLAREEREWARKNFGCTSAGNTAELFTERALSVTRPTGHFSFILPKKITYGFSWRSVRRLLLDGNRILSVTDVSQAFENVLLEQSIIVLRRGTTSNEDIGVFGCDEGTLYRVGRIPAGLFTDSMLPLWTEDWCLRLFRKVWQVSDPLAHDECHIYMGLGGVTSRFTAGPSGNPCVRGRQIGRYRLLPCDSFLPVTVPIVPSELRRMSQPKVLIQTIVAHITKPRPHIEIMATVDGHGHLVHDTVSYLVQEEYENGYLVAVLNSRFLSFYCYPFVFNNAIRTMHFIEPYAKRTPIRRISFTSSHAERHRLAEQGRTLVESRVTRLGAGGADETYAAFLKSELGQWVSARLEERPEQSDIIHDLLAHLAERTISMNKEKQTAAKMFLDWLAGYTGLPIEEWRLKTIVKAYWQHGWDEVRRALTQNRKAIEKASGRNVEGESALETIHSKFDQSVTQLEPLVQRIGTTDRLIDLIVYQLYGLTKEEVAIVEGPS